MENKVRTIIIDGVEIQTSLSAIEIADLPIKNAELQQENKLLRDRIRQGSSIYVIHNFEPDTNIVDLIDLLKDYEKDKQLERIKGESNV